MKKYPNALLKIEYEKVFPIGDFYEVEISTSDLIAELERRRPDCNKCNSDKLCASCVWDIKGIGTDNFKEAI